MKPRCPIRLIGVADTCGYLHRRDRRLVIAPAVPKRPTIVSVLICWRHVRTTIVAVVAACAFGLGPDAAAVADAPATPPTPRIATLAIPGDPRFVAVARDVLLVESDYTPDFASGAGLVDDGEHVPSFAPDHIAALTARIHRDLATLRALPWRSWSVDEQIDVRWVAANAERIDRELNVERLYLHRPGAWLETLANDYIAILSYVPERRDALAAITAGIPAMVSEMQTRCTPTQVDVHIADGIIAGIVAMLRANTIPGADAAIAALTSYQRRIDALRGLPPYAVIGAENYAWRMRHAELLPWSPLELRTLAEHELASVDAQIAALGPLPPAQPLSPELERAAAALDQHTLLEEYDAIQVQNRAAIEKAGFVTIPAGVGPIRARVTPDAMIPLTGDGGSMDPPPPFLPSNVGYWNVEHFDPAATIKTREETIRYALLYRMNDMGPYAAHEGLPGHHLQLSIARLNADPIRNLLGDAVQNEGWALYAEQEMWEQGGLGDSLQAHVATLESWRFRIRRVMYDVNVESGLWTLQAAADWKGHH